jgi:CheY-like chemotaxis protein
LFFTGDPAESVRKVLSAPAPSPRSLKPSVPGDLSDIAVRALALAPDQRFVSCQALALALSESSVEMYDEQQVGQWVRAQFPSELARTRSLLEAKETEAVRAVAGDPEGTPSGSRPRPTPSPAFPEPRGGTSAMLDASAGATILTVDDSKVGQLVLKAALVAEGFKVITCASAKEALEVLSQMQPELVVTDVQMPEMDGFELCREIRKRADLHAMPVVFLSVSCLVEERARGLEVGGDDFVRKPFSPGDITSRIRGHIRRVAVLRKAEATQ